MHLDFRERVKRRVVRSQFKALGMNLRLNSRKYHLKPRLCYLLLESVKLIIPAVCYEIQIINVQTQMIANSEHEKENAGLSSDNICPKETQLEKKVAPSLALTIQDHLIQQGKKLFEEEIFKESVVKCSLDKDFAYLFEESGLKIKRELPISAIANSKKPEKIHNLYQKTLISWLQSTEEKTLMHLPFKNQTEIFEVLNQKIPDGKLIIVVTEYHLHFSERLQTINQSRKDPIRWASLSSSLSIETKSKILELYQLRRLKLLLLTPELFENEKYQEFKCDYLILSGLHVYQNHSELLERILRQTQPERVLGCYEYLTKSYEKKLQWKNLGRQYQFENTVWLKGDLKCKNLLCYLSKRQSSRVIIITRDKRSADELCCSLSLEAYKVCNFTEIISKQVFKTFNLPGLLTYHKLSQEEQLLQGIKKTNGSTIIVSPWFEGLRLLQCDLVVFYDQPSIKQFMQQVSLSQSSLGLLSDEDYYISRNHETSSIVDRTIFQKAVESILDRRNPRPNERKVKRFYSDSLDELGDMDPVTNIKSITLNRFCAEFQISKPQLLNILSLLKHLSLLTIMEPMKYECLIEENSAEQFKEAFPNQSLMTRRVNILNLASQCKTTTQSILDIMKNQNIRFLVCEELIPIRLLHKDIESPVEAAWLQSQQEVLDSIREIDLSYSLLDQFTFPNTEFLRRDKILMKKKQMNFLFQEYLQGKLELSRLPMLKINNVNRKIIQEWVHSALLHKLTVHDIVLFLQGTLNHRTSIHQDEPIFKTFYKYKYEELAAVVEDASKNKKRKLN